MQCFSSYKSPKHSLGLTLQGVDAYLMPDGTLLIRKRYWASLQSRKGNVYVNLNKTSKNKETRLTVQDLSEGSEPAYAPSSIHTQPCMQSRELPF